MLEDACLLNDTSLLPDLIDVDAVLLARGTSQVRGRAAITNVIISQLRHGGSYVAAPAPRLDRQRALVSCRTERWSPVRVHAAPRPPCLVERVRTAAPV